jgi:hypothetical protein
VDATNLAPCHPGLTRRVRAHDVWRLTHCFAFACTAMRRTAIERVPLFASLHTDVPALARAYVSELLDRLPEPVRRPLATLNPAGAIQALMRRLRDRLLRRCQRVLVACKGDHAELEAVVGPQCVGRLRRGIDGSASSRQFPAGNCCPPVRRAFCCRPRGRLEARDATWPCGTPAARGGWLVTLVVAGRSTDAPIKPPCSATGLRCWATAYTPS